MTGRPATYVLLLALSGCMAAGAQAPGEDKAERDRAFSSEAALDLAFEETILPFFQQEGERGTFEGAGGVPISWAAWPARDETAALVILPGRAESYAKYAELIHDLSGRGFSLYIMDHRGQGLSGRMLSDPEHGYVDDWDHYVEDLHTFLEDVVGIQAGRRVVGIGHSMGGAILTSYAIAHPSVFDAIALSAPMHGINYGNFDEGTAYGLAVAAWNSWYAIGQGPYEVGEPFEGNPYTHSEARWEMKIAVNERLYPEARLGGVTFGWVVQSIEGMRAIRANASGLTTPSLLFQAGEDQTVDNEMQNIVCNASAACQLVQVDGARHELLMERDGIRNEVLSESLAFLSAPSP